ncbi:MAG: DUF692 domain-containing protein [Streptosporangiaceae bacterium]|jgi:uncharacterized protein (UPF0276 family)
MTSSTQFLDAIPYLGSGLGYRREIGSWILDAGDRVDVLEVVTEQFMQAEDELAALVDRFPVIPHGVGLSIGTAGPLDWEYLRSVKRVSDITGAPYYSEHLAVTRAPGIDIGHLSPVWFTNEVLRAVIDNVHAVQDFLGKPLVLENISYLFDIPNATMTQAEFFHRLVDATGCGLLLDVANVNVNAQNHRFDPVEFLDSMPLHAVVQIHMAGGFWSDGIYFDGHSEPVDEATWQLLDVLLERVPIRISIVERDANFPDELTPLLDDVDRIRRAISADRAPVMARPR